MITPLHKQEQPMISVEQPIIKVEKGPEHDGHLQQAPQLGDHEQSADKTVYTLDRLSPPTT